MSTYALFSKSGNFEWMLGKGIFAEAQSVPTALGIRANTRMTVTVVKHYLSIPYPIDHLVYF
jgi:hypothetical protein